MLVFVLRDVGSVKPLAVMTPSRFGTPVAAIRRFYQSLANLLLKLIADGIALTAFITKVITPFCSANLYFVTTIRILALIKRASAATCFFDFQMLFYLFGDGGGIAV